ncbi:hypothetical protein C9374_011140 [Naegleria lovaniensis]|uniref:Uncharacterized protein n=1 Tax=Naegleria lovaniensis TaxID=51637 RepID=A0AA88KFG9_NAELO|nr:uncharacterized protein C9374_011140 [Naegleria lovaniensis]KAG2374061.1 hypothetical protein C9374_011140 [Naegleria lovaniensis]
MLNKTTLSSSSKKQQPLIQVVDEEVDHSDVTNTAKEDHSEENNNTEQQNDDSESKIPSSFLNIAQKSQRSILESSSTTQPSLLLSRIRNFLPLIEKANAELKHKLSDEECVEIIGYNGEEEQDNNEEPENNSRKFKKRKYQPSDDQEETFKPYVEMNVALGVLEEKKQSATAKGSLIQEVNDEEADNDIVEENHCGSACSEESCEENTLRIGNEITPLDEKQQEQDFMAYMNLVSSLLGQTSDNVHNYESDDSSYNEQQDTDDEDVQNENSESNEKEGE